MNKTAHIFITGATGFLGSYIVRNLIYKGYTNVFCLKRENSSLDLLNDVADKVQWIIGDLFDYQLLSESMRDIDYVIHSAAIISFIPSEFEDMKKVNVDGTTNMLNAALENNVKHFLQISSVSALGRSLGRPIIDEECKFEKTDLDSGYGLTKHLADMDVRRAGAEGLNWSIIHPSMIMGAGFWDSGTPKLIHTVWSGLKYYPMGTGGFVDVRDVADMCVLILEKEYINRNVICVAENLTFQKVITAISQHLNKKAPRIKLSKILIGFAWRFEAIRAKLKGQKPIITKETLNTSSHNFTFNTERSIEELSFTYRSISQTLEETCHLFLEAKDDNFVAKTLNF